MMSTRDQKTLAADATTRDARFSRGLLILALTLSFILTAFAFRINIQLTELANESYARSDALSKTAHDLRYFDEVLSYSAVMAAQTGKPDWEARYNKFAPLLDASLKAAITPATQQTLQVLSAANNQLIEIETQLFALVHQGLTEQALQLMQSERYTALKKEYTDSLQILTDILKRESQNSVSQIDVRESQARRLRRAGLAIIVAVWLGVAFNNAKLRKLLIQSNAKLASQAHYDSLTGIANRTLFLDRLQQSLIDSARNSGSGALLLLDLDDFKGVNDSLGHPIGDQLLTLVATRIKQACRASDTVARLGGDEFAIIAQGISPLEQTTVLAEKLIGVLQKPIKIDGNTINAQASIGIACYPNDANEADELLRKADLALYKAKSQGKNIHAYFDEEIERSAKHRQQLEFEIKRGIEQQEFELFYQPVVRLDEKVITGVEALIRWRHPERGFVAPDEFIPVAEQSRLIIPLGQWVYEQACAQQRRWLEQGLPALTMSVNLSSVQFEDEHLYDGIMTTLTREGLDPNYFIAEITESTLMSAVSTSNRAIDPINVLQRLHNNGVKVAIDDFGTGYSSLAYLKRLPIHLLKIDRAFVNGLPADSEDVAISRAVLNLGNALNLKVVAEGIENKAQMDFLQAERCCYGQGYYFGKPMPAWQFEELYNTSRMLTDAKDPQSNTG